MGKFLTIILSLFLLTTPAFSSDIVGENGFGQYHCSRETNSLQCSVHKEYVSLDKSENPVLIPKLKLTKYRIYALSMVMALASMEMIDSNDTRPQIIVEFQDGWSYKIKTVEAIMCVMNSFQGVDLSDPNNGMVENQIACIIPKVIGGLKS